MSIIAAGTTTTTALSSTGNTDGTLQFQVNGTTPSVTLNALGAVGVGASPNFGTSGQALVSGGATAAPTWANVTTSPAGTTGQVQINNAGAFGAVSSGTTGQVLTSQGTGAAPVFATLNAASGVNYQQFDSSGTWTKPSGYPASSRVLIECWGGGGSGGKRNYGEDGVFFQGGGGGGGAYSYAWVLLSVLGATETVTIGAGGAAQTASSATGVTGGTTSFGALCLAYGGAGGGFTGRGGGGGGQLSAGNSNVSGSPVPAEINTGAQYFPEGAGGIGGFTTNQAQTIGVSSLYKGGGGGGTWYSAGNYGKGEAGGASVWGGGGGGAGGFDGTYGPGAGGASSNGGAGGAGSVSTTATSGAQPGGGGGGTRTGTSGAGGNGRVRVTVFAGV